MLNLLYSTPCIEYYYLIVLRCLIYSLLAMWLCVSNYLLYGINKNNFESKLHIFQCWNETGFTKNFRRGKDGLGRSDRQLHRLFLLVKNKHMQQDALTYMHYCRPASAKSLPITAWTELEKISPLPLWVFGKRKTTDAPKKTTQSFGPR